MRRPQAWRPEEPLRLIELIAASGYLLGLALPILAVLVAFALLLSAASS